MMDYRTLRDVDPEMAAKYEAVNAQIAIDARAREDEWPDVIEDDGTIG